MEKTIFQILTNKFLYFALLIRTELLNSFYRGAGLKHPSMDDVLNMEIEIPSLIEEQVQITDILCNMDLEIQALQDERNKYALIKQGMMQELLTGKTRI